MAQLVRELVDLVQSRDVRVSVHGYDELAADGIALRDVLDGISEAELVREYPRYAKGPCALLLQRDGSGRPLHVVWGIVKGTERPAVLVTAYRPDPDTREPDWKTRRTR